MSDETSSPSDRLLAEIDAAHQVHLEKQQVEIDAVKSNLRGRELFDIDVFAGIYRLGSDQNGAPYITPEITREYERGYYLRHPEFRTMQQYADYLRRMDVYDSSGSD